MGYDFTEGKIGGNVVRKNNLNILKSIDGLKVDTYFIKNDKSKRKLLSNFLRFSFNGGTAKIINEIENVIRNGNYSHIFFDGSLFGKLVKRIKLRFQDIKIIVFFHNIEYLYYLDRVKAEGIQNTLALPSIFYNEHLSAKFSDDIIVLNERDKINLFSKYKIEATCIIPISLNDDFDQRVKLESSEYDYLFIGSNFYANSHGISWFIQKVLPSLPGKLLVIGRGMEVLSKKFKNSNKLKILGEVENLQEYYNLQNVIVSPIFYGSGMKTKTIEALMHGKTIVGTEEAFVGVKKNNLSNNFVCNTKKDFIKILSDERVMNMARNTNMESRGIYLDSFSISSSIVKFKELFN